MAEPKEPAMKLDLAKRGIDEVRISVWYGSPAFAIIEAAQVEKIVT